MNPDSDEQRLRHLFREQRLHDGRSLPSFKALRDAAAGGQPVHRAPSAYPVILVATALLTGAVGIVSLSVWQNRRPLSQPSPTPSISDWKSPTEFLLTLNNFSSSLASSPPAEAKPVVSHPLEIPPEH